MTTAEKIKEYLNRNDRFVALSHIRLTSIGEERATAELEIAPELLNSNSVVQGGAIFTLADFCFAGAANAGNRIMVTQSSSITFIRPGTGRRLFAEAHKISRGRSTGVYCVQVTDEEGKAVAFATFNGFAPGGAFLPELEEK